MTWPPLEIALSAATLAVEIAQLAVCTYWLRRWKRHNDARARHLAELVQANRAIEARGNESLRLLKEAIARAG